MSFQMIDDNKTSAYRRCNLFHETRASKKKVHIVQEKPVIDVIG